MTRLIGAVGLSMALMGCSFSAKVPAVRYSPETHGYPVCDRQADGRAVADGVWAGLFLMPSVAYATLIASGDVDFDDGELAPFAITAALGVLFLAAINSGFSKTAKCEAAHMKYELWYEQRVRRP